MSQLIRLKEELHRVIPTLSLREQEPMSRHTTFRVGGPAALMALPRTEEEVLTVVRTAHELGVCPIYVGNGSNLLASDAGIDGFVVKLSDGFNQIYHEGTQIIAEGGALLSRIASYAQKNGLSGLEFAHGIPGTLGGAVTMNAGAYGGEMVQVVKEVRYLNQQGEVCVATVEECEFSYRHSVFVDGSKLIVSAVFELQPKDPAEIQAVMDDLMSRRKEKQPLEYPSAGSTFKRPEGYFAAALIDQCGLKGFSVGGAQVSEKHAGFVVNKGGATCNDILELMDQVKKCVFDKTGVTLEPEVKFIGV